MPFDVNLKSDIMRVSIRHSVRVCKLVRSEGGPLGECRFKLLVQNVGFCCRITVQFTI